MLKSGLLSKLYESLDIRNLGYIYNTLDILESQTRLTIECEIYLGSIRLEQPINHLFLRSMISLLLSAA